MAVKLPVALQLYTVREDTSKDFVGTLKEVSKIGYHGVELAGLGTYTAKELRKVLDDLNLRAISAHVPLENMEKDLQKEIDDAKTLGLDYIVVPYLQEDRRKAAEDYIKLAEQLDIISEKCTENDLQLCYHNHDFEFQKFNDKYALNILFENIPEEKLKWEIDTFWVKYAGLNPVDYLRNYGSKIPIVHLKDMIKDEKPVFAEVGEGIMDMENIIETSNDIGAKWLVVEQDICKRPALESARISFENIKKWVVV
ncbi:MAG: sugar phosphate isomerase/epimerase [Xylanivirga thermophila]|jgi:sugar phosphate isomerase/epimerase|uniref:sugar phosphate isomerase/epimerase family protein n=1 Tax=Xylanivirga thermophila TaxID=2496273 RepID=UPI00101D4CD3|nr:sugar phosphate isomerase/epimerase [Xylanivirga thermophila]